MKELKYFCDICGKEFPPNEYSFLIGQIIKVDEKLVPHQVPFEKNYCGECTQLLLAEITKLKNAKHNDTK